MSNHRAPPPEWLNAEYIQNILRDSLKKPDFKVKKVEVSPGSAVGDNYACQILRIAVYHGNNNEKLSIIGKLKPNTKLLESLDDTLDIFEVEGKFFSQVVDQLKTVTQPEKFLPIPYFVDFEKNIILLEDLKEKNFYLQPRGQQLSFDQAKLVFAALATYHGSSAHLIQKDPKLKITFGKFIWTSEPDAVLSKFIFNSVSSLEKWLHLYNVSEDQERKIRALRKKLETEFFKVCEYKQDGLNFLLHGDCWMNNMMFHKTNDRIDDVRLLDFQIVSYNSFANDLQYFLFSSVQTDVIFNNLDELLEIYYKKLKETAPGNLNITLERVKTEFMERLYFGMIMAFMFRPFMGSEIPFDFDKILEGQLQDSGFNSPRFVADFQKLVVYFEKLGVL